MYERIGSRKEPKSLSADEMSVLVSRPDGQVVGVSQAARRLLGSVDRGSCWAMMKSVPDTMGLPCTEGCVRALLSDERSLEARRVLLRGRRFELRCEPVGDQIVTTLRAQEAKQPNDVERLTPREVEVLKLLAKGLDGGEIAQQLEIRIGTVRTHVEHMRERLGSRTRAGLVAKGYQLHYLP